MIENVHNLNMSTIILVPTAYILVMAPTHAMFWAKPLRGGDPRSKHDEKANYLQQWYTM